MKHSSEKKRKSSPHPPLWWKVGCATRSFPGLHDVTLWIVHHPHRGTTFFLHIFFKSLSGCWYMYFFCLCSVLQELWNLFNISVHSLQVVEKSIGAWVPPFWIWLIPIHFSTYITLCSILIQTLSKKVPYFGLNSPLLFSGRACSSMDQCVKGFQSARHGSCAKHMRICCGLADRSAGFCGIPPSAHKNYSLGLRFEIVCCTAAKYLVFPCSIKVGQMITWLMSES